MYKCSECGGTNLGARAILDLNTKEFIDWDDVYDEVWRYDCEDYVKVTEDIRTLIIMDYSTGKIHVYNIHADLDVTDDFIEKLGYNIDEVSWMITENYDVEEHKGIFRKNGTN